MKLLFCSSFKKKNQKKNLPRGFTHVFYAPPPESLQLRETSFLIDPCRGYNSVDIAEAKRSPPSKRSEYTNEAFHIREN